MPSAAIENVLSRLIKMVRSPSRHADAITITAPVAISPTPA